MKLISKLVVLINIITPLVSCGSKSGFSYSSSSDTSSESYIEPVDPVINEYDEEEDSLDGVDPNDLSRLYNAFTGLTSYKSTITSYFNSVGLRDYYRHYQKNYIQESVTLFDQEKCYSYTTLEEYFDLLNIGFLNRNNNYYSFSKRGSTISERLENNINEEDVALVKEDARYQDDVFSLFNLSTEYLQSKTFTRVSKNKYQITDLDELNSFLSICAPHLNNTGFYMTFSRATIEIDPKEGINARVRLYASVTQGGKIIESHKDKESKPNWYLLFSEAVITL